jgi:DNA-binding NtrC family response regulator
VRLSLGRIRPRSESRRVTDGFIMSHLQVLIVAHDQRVLEAMSATLRRGGYRVIATTCSAAARDILRVQRVGMIVTGSAHAHLSTEPHVLRAVIPD